MSIVSKYFTKLLEPENHLVKELKFSGKKNFAAAFNICFPDLPEIWLVKIVDDQLMMADEVDAQTCKLAFVLDADTFSAVISGTISVQKAFLNRKIEIKGNLFKGMMLAKMLGNFFKQLAEYNSEPTTAPMAQMENEFPEELLQIKLDATTTVTASMGYHDDCLPTTVRFIFPPHPILGGDIDNNVINMIYAAAVARGEIAVKFNYRLVEPQTVEAHTMLDYWRKCEANNDYEQVVADSITVIQSVMKSLNRELKLEFAAYSFGCYIAMQTMNRLPVNNFIGISPPLFEYDFEPLFAKHRGLNFIIADGDEFCPQADFSKLAATYGINLHTVQADDHFFRGCEQQLKQCYELISS